MTHVLLQKRLWVQFILSDLILGYHVSAAHSRIIWTIILTAGLVAFMDQLRSSTEHYLSRPVSVNLKHIHNNSMLFPAVTICNQNAFRWASTVQ